MKNIAQLVSFFENSNNKVTKPRKNASPKKLNKNNKFIPRIIAPAGGIPMHATIPQSEKPKPKSPKLIKNKEIVNQPPQKIDKEAIKNNMNNMKVLIEKRGIIRKPFIIERSIHQNPKIEINQNKEDKQKPIDVKIGISNKSIFERKNMFEPKKNNNNYINNDKKIIESKPMRKDIKKKAKATFE